MFRELIHRLRRPRGRRGLETTSFHPPENAMLPYRPIRRIIHESDADDSTDDRADNDR